MSASSFYRTFANGIKHQTLNMHQTLIHNFLVRMTLCVIMLFSVAGYHHHEAAHICLGWEHLMLHNHCQKGNSCQPTENNGQESHCHCHSGKIFGLGQSLKKSIRKTSDSLTKATVAACFVSFFIFSQKSQNIGFSTGNTPRGPCPELFPSHGLRAPPYI